MVSEAKLMKRFPSLKRSKWLQEDGKCYFVTPYSHLNELLKFEQTKNFNVRYVPSPCLNQADDRPLILFGIKSMPKSTEMRQSLRETWLNQTYWNARGVDIKVVFLVASTKNELQLEIENYDDILQVDFDESHYLLPLKDIAFLDYFKDSCKQANFLFKGKNFET